MDDTSRAIRSPKSLFFITLDHVTSRKKKKKKNPFTFFLSLFSRFSCSPAHTLPAVGLARRFAPRDFISCHGCEEKNNASLPARLRRHSRALSRFASCARGDAAASRSRDSFAVSRFLTFAQCKVLLPLLRRATVL